MQTINKRTGLHDRVHEEKIEQIVYEKYLFLKDMETQLFYISLRVEQTITTYR